MGYWLLQCCNTCRLCVQIEDGGGSRGRAGALPRRLALATDLHEGAGCELAMRCSAGRACICFTLVKSD